jgi:hypothetical protein
MTDKHIRLTARPILDLAELIALASRAEGLRCFISLAGGLARSFKTIRYLPPQGAARTGKFDILNEIDDTWQTLWPKQLWTQSNIGAALDGGALFALRPGA